MYTSIRDVSRFLDLTFTTVHVFLIISLTSGCPVRIHVPFVYLYPFLYYLPNQFIRIYVYS